ncbi:hypothetical protein CPC735_047410 [Coccidioides posadasii C735 delta SOWgp]|uniref:FERM domain-containing protein n=1 Tax=Coccidioides posadasii (strain C735) TaxID=222929 RepID=C5PFR8_COCP7|nr:hypothetical protein CPC735_047410 [Coccidioides posadasii C735 delta SOWgp]EER23371.1 hypothetical protein CPC735_047410 [Coccidioides posadasii C735 delta SOWgp]|eukprot:XP_003065516.1 hypothetical protein CPC735_047410 [Coccidioides posadasii C735 delta SOWgp]
MELDKEPTQGYNSTLLYGGAMSVELPKGWKNMSNVRPIPDNQEVFASGTGYDMSVIVELLERVESDSEAMHAAVFKIPPGASTEDVDALALLAHIHDICDANRDQFEVVDGPKSSHPTGRTQEGPTYVCEVNILSHSTRINHSNALREPDQVTKCYTFMVRLVQQGTDMLVHVNLPITLLKYNSDPSAVPDAERQAKDILEHLMNTLNFIDFSMFG